MKGYKKLATGKQIRAGRVLLGWEAKELARLAGVTERSILNCERGDNRPKITTMEKIVKAFTIAGIEFIEGEGVKHRTDDVEVFTGRERFNEFTDLVYRHLCNHGGDVCISAVDETLFAKYRNDFEGYTRRMKDLVGSGKVRVRILANIGHFRSEFAQYRRQKAENATPVAFYTFGDCFALISFAREPAPYVVLHRGSPFTAAWIESFNRAWEAAERP